MFRTFSFGCISWNGAKRRHVGELASQYTILTHHFLLDTKSDPPRDLNFVCSYQSPEKSKIEVTEEKVKRIFSSFNDDKMY